MKKKRDDQTMTSKCDMLETILYNIIIKMLIIIQSLIIIIALIRIILICYILIINILSN